MGNLSSNARVANQLTNAEIAPALHQAMYLATHPNQVF